METILGAHLAVHLAAHFFFHGSILGPSSGVRNSQSEWGARLAGKIEQVVANVRFYICAMSWHIRKKKTLETEVSFNSFLRQIQRDIKSKPYSIAL